MLKVKGIRLLADALVANKKLYNQQTFGVKDHCGTVCCLAGFCLLEVVGRRKFNSMIKNDEEISDACVDAGRKQLGITNKEPQLFSPVSSWPLDLETEYHQNGPRGRVVVALKALQRLQPSGRIDRDPKAIHTRLPQLKALLAKAKS